MLVGAGICRFLSYMADALTGYAFSSADFSRLCPAPGDYPAEPLQVFPGSYLEVALVPRYHGDIHPAHDCRFRGAVDAQDCVRKQSSAGLQISSEQKYFRCLSCEDRAPVQQGRD